MKELKLQLRSQRNGVVAPQAAFHCDNNTEFDGENQDLEAYQFTAYMLYIV